MKVKFNKIEVKREHSNGYKYVQRTHKSCQKCRDATAGLIGQVDCLALPYAVRKREAKNE